MRAEGFFKKNTNVFLIAMLCCLLWGSGIPGIKIGQQILHIEKDNISSLFLFAGVRFAFAGIIGLFCAKILLKKWPVPQKADWHMILKVSLFQTVVQYTLMYIGTANSTGIKSSIMGSAGNFIVILLACFVFRQEPFTKSKALGCILGFTSIVVINFSKGNIGESMTLAGEGAVFLSSVSYAIARVLTKQYSQQMSPAVLSGYQFFVGGVALTLIGISTGGSIKVASFAGSFIILYLAIVSAISFLLWSLLLKYNPISKVSIYGIMIPVFSVLISAIILREGAQVNWVQTACALFFACSGIMVINRN